MRHEKASQLKGGDGPPVEAPGEKGGADIASPASSNLRVFPCNSVLPDTVLGYEYRFVKGMQNV